MSLYVCLSVCRNASILLNVRFTKQIHLKKIVQFFECQLPLHFINNGNELLLLLPPFYIVVQDLFWKMRENEWTDSRVQAQYSAVQYSTVQHGTVQYNTVQYSTVQYSTARQSTVQYSTVQYSTVQHSTVQYSTVHHSTVQYSTVQYSTKHNSCC